MDTQNFVYHASSQKGLKYLEPRKSTHQESWVYATKELSISAMFLGENFDFICQCGTENGKPQISEQFEGALELAYKGKSGVIYKLSANSFLEGKTSWSAEVVSETKVKVIEEIKVNDALEFLIDLEKQGKLKIYRYPNKPEGYPTDKSDIVERTVDWVPKFGEDILDKAQKYHPDTIERSIKELKKKNYTPKSEKWKLKFEKLK